MSELFPTPDGPARTVTPSFRSPALVPSSSPPPPPSSSSSPSPLVVVARVFSLDASSRSSASIPSPVATDTNRGRYPHWNVGVELKDVRSGVERRRGVSGLKARDPGRRDAPGTKVLKNRRSPRRRGRMGTSVMT
eukprot:30536-Pelagococcus_subviridis.AAC.1